MRTQRHESLDVEDNREYFRYAMIGDLRRFFEGSMSRESRVKSRWHDWKDWILGVRVVTDIAGNIQLFGALTSTTDLKFGNLAVSKHPKF